MENLKILEQAVSQIWQIWSSDVCWFRWRVLALKVKFGLGANFLAIKKRNLNDINTFIDQETEVVSIFITSRNQATNFQEATKEDQMDLEGKCMRKKVFLYSLPNVLSIIHFFRRTSATSDVVVCELGVLREGTDSETLDLQIFPTAWTCASKTLQIMLWHLLINAIHTILMPL